MLRTNSVLAMMGTGIQKKHECAAGTASFAFLPFLGER